MGQAQSSTIKMNGTHAVLCKGQGLALYKISSQNEMVFTILRSRGCSEEEFRVLRALDSVIFFRIRDFSILHLYNYRAAPVLTAFFENPLAPDQPITYGSTVPQSPPPKPK